KRERKAKSVNESESKRDQPPSLEARADDILERHVHNRQRDQDLDQWRKPQSVGRKAEYRRDQRDRVRDRERGDDRDERSHLSERNDQANDEQQVVDTIENVREPERNEPLG